MIELAVTGTLALITLLVKIWLSRQDTGPLEAKNKALEKAAEVARQKEHDENVKKAETINASTDRDAAIEFLRDSFRREVHPPKNP